MRCPAHTSDAFNGQCKALPDAYTHPDQGTLRPVFRSSRTAVIASVSWRAHLVGIRRIDDQSAHCEALREETANATDASRCPPVTAGSGAILNDESCAPPFSDGILISEVARRSSSRRSTPKKWILSGSHNYWLLEGPNNIARNTAKTIPVLPSRLFRRKAMAGFYTNLTGRPMLRGPTKTFARGDNLLGVPALLAWRLARRHRMRKPPPLKR